MRALLRRHPDLVRRALQLAVLAFIVYTALGASWRNYKIAHNQARLVALMEGPVWGALYALNENVLSIAGDSFQTSLAFLGFPWAGRVFGLNTADPFLVASLLVKGILPPLTLLGGLAVPIALTLLLGKVFCSHLCPMRLLFELGEELRAGLLRLGVPLPEWRSPVRFGGFVLLGGLLASALSSAAIWLLLLPYASLGAGIHLLVAGGAAGGLLAVVAFWLGVDVGVAPGGFCHNLCPTGFVLEQLGRFRWLRVRKRASAMPCPGSCNQCQQTCPYALLPREDTPLPACDSCGRCVATCPGGRLERRLALPRLARTPLALPLLALPLLGVAALTLLPAVAHAHHNKGMPHYGYFENYAQVPSEEFVGVEGAWEMGVTLFNFQGMKRRSSDTPNDVKLYVYLFDLNSQRGYTGPVDFEIRGASGSIARFRREHVDEEAVYSTRETLPHTGDYELVARFAGNQVGLPFHVDLRGDGVRWPRVAALAAALAGLFALASIGRSRRRRGQGRRARRLSRSIRMGGT